MSRVFSSRRPWSIRNKLMAFVLLLCALLIGLVYFLSIVLLEPAYNTSIRRDLENTTAQMVALIDDFEEPLVEYDIFGGASGNDDFAALLSEQIASGTLHITGRCVEISDMSTGLQIMSSEALPGTCLVHTSDNRFDDSDSLAARNSKTARWLRYLVLQNGPLRQKLVNSVTESSQMVVGRLSADGRYVVLISADLERIPQAVSVLAGQMKWVALILLAVSLAGAWIFSRWFTRPITQLSLAAREMAKGNYDVRVKPLGADELGILGEDFNTMAAEVARTSQLQQDLIANVSHDLRTPLTLIKGYAETVRDLTGEDTRRRTEQMNVIVDETDRLSSLVNSVMELSRMSSGVEKPQPVQFDLAQLCEEVAQRYEDVCGKNGYTFLVETDVSCPVFADPAMMERVLHNLLGNALHHIGTDGWLRLAIRPLPGGGCRVEVGDHGCGIAPEDLPHLFDKYYRSRKDAGKTGSGLGLSIVKAILQNHGFRFGVQSEVGKGSTFWFETKPAPEALKA